MDFLKQISYPETDFSDKKEYWLLLALAAAVLVLSLPTPEGLTVTGHRFLALLAGLVVIFLTESLPLPIAMGGSGVMLSLMGIGEVDKIWPAYAHPVVFFVLGCLMLATIVEQVGLSERLGNFLLKYCGNNIVRFSFFSCMFLGFISGFMHDVSSITIGLVTILPLMRAARIKPGSSMGKFLVLSMTFCCSAGGMGTLVGGGRNMVAAAFLKDFTGIEISFLDWLIHAMVPALLTLPVIWSVVYLIFRPDTSVEFPKKVLMNTENRKISLSEILTLVVIGLVFVGFLTGNMHGFDYSVIVFLGVFILTVLGITDWEDLNKKTAWPIAFLVFGGGIALGRAMDYTGTAAFVADIFFPFFSGRNFFLLIIGVALFGTLFSEVMANVAAAALIIPIAIPISLEMGLDPRVIAFSLGMFTSFAYLMVIGCPPNAIAYSFGYFKTSDLFKTGIITETVAIIFMLLVVWIWWSLLGTIN